MRYWTTKALKSILSVGLLLTVMQANAWVIEADFETGTLGRQADDSEGDTSGFHYTWPVSEGGRTVFSDERPHSGNQSAKATISAGSGGWGEWGGFWTTPERHTQNGDEQWMRVWLWFPSDFYYDPAQPGTKGMRFKVYDNGGSARYINMYPKSTHILMENWVNLSAFYSNTTDAQRKDYPDLSGWESIEMYVKFHTSPGSGIFRIWRNDVLVFEDRLTKTFFPGGYSENILLFTLYSNNSSPIEQSTFIDDVIITNTDPGNTDAAGNAFIGMGDFDPPDPPDPVSSPPDPIGVGENVGENVGVQCPECHKGNEYGE